MSECNPVIEKALVHHAFKGIHVPQFEKTVFYKFMDKVDHVLLVLMIVEEKKEYYKSNELMNATKKLQVILEKRPYLIHQVIRDRKFTIKSKNLFKGLNRFNYVARKSLRLHLYDDKPVILSFLSTMIDDDLDEIRSKMIKKQGSCRIDHVPTSEFEEYLVDIYQYHDQQLRDIKFKSEKKFIEYNDKIFSIFVMFMLFISIFSLIESFIRINPLISLPMGLMYIVLSYFIIQVISWSFYRRLKTEEKFRLYCPIIYGQPFEILKEKKFENKNQVDALIEDLHEIPNEIESIKEEIVTIEPELTEIPNKIESVSSQESLQSAITYDCFKKTTNFLLEKWSNNQENSVEFKTNMCLTLRNALAFRYGHVLNHGRPSSGIRKIFLTNESEFKKLQEIKKLCDQKIKLQDKIYEKHVNSLSALLSVLLEDMSKEDVKTFYKAVKVISLDLLSFEKVFQPVNENLEELIKDEDEVETIPESGDIFTDRITNLETLITGANGGEEKLRKELQLLASDLIKTFHEDHVKEPNGETSLIQGLINHFSKKNSIIVPILKEINQMLLNGIPDLKEYFLLLVEINKFKSNPEEQAIDLLIIDHEDTLKNEIPIISVTHDKNSSEKLLELTQERKPTETLVTQINIEQFDNYWKYSKSILLIYDEESKQYINELMQTIRRMGLIGFKEFNLDVTRSENWNSIEKPIIIFRNEAKSKFIIDKFDPSTFRDLIDDAPTSEGDIDFTSFSELKDEIIRRIGKKIHVEETETDFLEDNYHERMEEMRRLNGKDNNESEDKYAEIKFGIHPKTDYERISNKEDLNKALKIRKPVIYILHDENQDVEQVIPNLETSYSIRSVEKEVYLNDDMFQRLMLTNFGVHEGDFNGVKLFRREKKTSKVITLQNFYNSLERNHNKIVSRTQDDILSKINETEIPKSLIGAIIAQFDNTTGPEIKYKVGRMNGDYNLNKLVQNILDDSELKNMQVSFRKYDKYKICFIIRREESEKYERGLLLESYIIFLGLDVPGSFFDELEKEMKNMKIFHQDNIQDRGNAFYYNIIKFMEAHEHEI